MKRKIERLKNYINGEWVESKSTEFLKVENPGTGEVLVWVPNSTEEEVDLVVNSAKEASVGWGETPVQERVRYLYKLREKLEEHFEELAKLITLVHGKVLNEARGEVRRLIENVEASFGIPHLIMGKNLPGITQNIDVFSYHHSLGVFAHIPPFNFPGMIPFWYLPYAVGCGVSFIVKPSEQVPTVMTRIFELLDEIDFPPGVLSLIHGDKKVVQALIKHPELTGVCSVTSTKVARDVSIECAKYGKRFCCQGGAKNFIGFSESLLGSKEAFNLSIKNSIDSVYGNTNQRCMAGSNVVGFGKIYPILVDSFTEAAQKIKVGYGLDPTSTMGPLVSRQAKERVLEFIEIGIKEGAKLVLDGRNVKVENYPKGYYLGPTIFKDVEPEMTIAREEIFGPVACLMRMESLDQLINLINTQTSKFNNYRYGNAAMLYTELGREAREFKLKVECGDIGINIGLPAPTAYFPFAGMKDSFYGIMHGQLPDAIRFFMDIKSITERWW